MTDLLIWGGPVSTKNLDGVVWQRPTDVITVNKGAGGAINSDAFRDLAQSVKSSDGRILPGLLALYNKSPSDYDQIAIAGFSAFHGLASPLLLADGDRIAAAVLLDACFSSAANPPKAGFVSFGARAALREKLMILTVSGEGGGNISTGSDCGKVNATAAAAKAGVALAPYEPSPPVPSLQGGTGQRAGDLILLDYRKAFRHEQHVTIVGKKVLTSLLAPYLAGASPAPGPVAPEPAEPAPGEPADDSSFRGVLFLGGLIAAAGGYYLVRRRGS